MSDHKRACKTNGSISAEAEVENLLCKMEMEQFIKEEKFLSAIRNGTELPPGAEAIAFFMHRKGRRLPRIAEEMAKNYSRRLVKRVKAISGTHHILKSLRRRQIDSGCGCSGSALERSELCCECRDHIVNTVEDAGWTPPPFNNPFAAAISSIFVEATEDRNRGVGRRKMSRSASGTDAQFAPVNVPTPSATAVVESSGDNIQSGPVSPQLHVFYYDVDRALVSIDSLHLQ